MEIQYLKNLEKEIENKNKFSSTHFTEGISEEAIEKVENELNVKFPKAYKEFLILAGEGVGFGFGNAIDHAFDWAVEDFQQNMQELLDEFKVNLQKKHWAFTSFNSESFDFFYLDGNDDPIVYLFDPYTTREVKDVSLPKGVTKSYDKFSDYVNACIEGHKKGML